MSTTGWIFLGILFSSPFIQAAKHKDETTGGTKRHRRSLTDLNSMVQSIIGREGSDFIGYGNWCGLGGSGRPVDPVDECCEVHDMCYVLASEGPCKDKGEKGVYQIEYQWSKKSDGTASCKNVDRCPDSICLCDALLTNCLKNNLDSYDEKNLHKLDFLELFREANWLTED
ncbi:phospholipase A2 A2-actitoxin-Cgg2a-like isoform X2 [Stegodyphus dumicola]|uniref:phospholipase A2 A2-actitoxin-Cgg2a-like isoform X2 n=1 Tax=Stegodyphus dumicola TaxID=202533 RepID=UPI0015B2A00C|nr:phospholipase A2 A2-actitoxin-Cgg2a-like isoform X2 [Stegodyphus dumicola]